MLRNHYFSIILSSALFMTGLSTGQAEEVKKPWKFESEAAYSKTTGNTQTETLGSKNRFDYDWTRAAFRAKANAYTAEEKDRTTAENYFAEEKWEWKINKKNYLFNMTFGAPIDPTLLEGDANEMAARLKSFVEDELSQDPAARFTP